MGTTGITVLGECWARNTAAASAPKSGKAEGENRVAALHRQIDLEAELGVLDQEQIGFALRARVPSHPVDRRTFGDRVAAKHLGTSLVRSST
jgi:hypothetical protein